MLGSRSLTVKISFAYCKLLILNYMNGAKIAKVIRKLARESEFKRLPVLYLDSVFRHFKDTRVSLALFVRQQLLPR